MRERRPSPSRGPANPPGQQRLVYRVGSYDEFLQQMLDRLVMTLQASADAGGEDAVRVARLNLDDADHWLLGLARSWATVADILTFYQERLVHEGYLRTAVEARSVHALVRMVAYVPLPGVAGSTDLAVWVTDVEGLPRELELSPGLVVRSKPPPGAEPQVFETAEPLVARADLNELPFTPRRRRLPPRVSGDAAFLDLEGTAPGMVPGAPLLVAGVVGPVSVRAFQRVTAVEPVPGEAPSTRLHWAGPLVPEAVSAVVEEAAPFTFDRRSHLFGHSAPPWQGLPPEARRAVQPLEGGVLLFDTHGWRSANRGLPSTTTVLSLAVDDLGWLYAGTRDQGVFRSRDGGESWEPASRGLVQNDVRALAEEGRGILYAGTANGVYRTTDRGAVWEPANGEDPRMGVGRLPWLGRLPGRRRTPGGRLPAGPVRDLAVVRWDRSRILFAGTTAGVFRSTDGGRHWLPANQGLPGVAPDGATADVVVESLVAGPQAGLLYAGTDTGVHRTADGGVSWEPLNKGLPTTDPFHHSSTTRVHDLAILADRRGGAGHRLLAATHRGLYRLDAAENHWQGVVLDPAHGVDVPVRRLAVWEDPETFDRHLFAAGDDGLWESTDESVSWRRVSPFPAAAPEALAAAAGGPALAATPFGSFGDEWPGFALCDGQVDLDSVVDGVVPGSWIVLDPVSAGGEGEAGVYRVEEVATVRRTDFGLSATVTRLRVEPDPGLGRFGLRDTRVWLESRPLRLARGTETEYGPALELLIASLEMLPATRRIAATGHTPPHTYRRLLEPGEALVIFGELDRELAAIAPDRIVRVRLWLAAQEGTGGGEDPGSTAPAGTDPALDVEITVIELVRTVDAWMVAPAAGEEEPDGAGGAPPEEPDQAAPSVAGDPGADGTSRRAWGSLPAGELVAALASLEEGGTPAYLRIDVEAREAGAVLTAGELILALRNDVSQDPGRVRLPPPPGDTVALELALEDLTVHGNVVRAVEGTTVSGEILGDGDGTRANQTFPLAQPPNFRRAPAGPENSVRVRVQGQAWRPVERLHGQPPGSRVFRLDLDHLGGGTVIFGDGESGARLPTGHDNVVATYRTGMTMRQVPADGVSLLQSRPLGLDEVANPLPTVPGAAPEPLDRVRSRAPASVRTLGRVVSLADHADHARRFPGVARAGAWSLAGDGRPTVQVTVAAEGGRPLEPGSGLLVELHAALNARRPTTLPLVVQSYERVEVEVRANLRIVPGFLWSEVEPRVRAALVERFGFERSHFGGGITASAVVWTMQRVRGVAAVDLDALRWPGMEAEAVTTTPDGIARERRARPPGYHSGRFEPAELVVLGAVHLRSLHPLDRGTS